MHFAKEVVSFIFLAFRIAIRQKIAQTVQDTGLRPGSRSLAESQIKLRNYVHIKELAICLNLTNLISDAVNFTMTSSRGK